MSSITFDSKLIGTSYHSTISFDYAFKIYDIFDPDQVITPVIATGTNIVFNRLDSTNIEDQLGMENVINLGNIGEATVIALTQEVGQGEAVKLYEVRVGANPRGSIQIYLECTISRGSSSGSGANYYRNVGVKYNLRVDEYGTIPVTTNLWTQSLRIYPNSSTLADHIGFGLGFFQLPNREDVPNNLLMFPVTVEWHKTGESINTYLQKYSASAQYYEFPQMLSYGRTHVYLTKGYDLSQLYLFDGAVFLYDESSPEAGPPSEPGGYQPDGTNFDDSSDTIDVPDAPTIGVTSVGFVNVYKTGNQSLQNMGVELFPDLVYTNPTTISSQSVAEAIVDGFNQIVGFLANIPSFFEQIVASTLINYIIDCHILPVTPSGGTTEYIKVGYKQLSCQGSRLSSDYVDVDCGTISLAEYYTNFADFLTTFKLYLPFVGFVSAQPEWFYRESLNVYYRFNVIDGSFMAFVRSTGAYVNNNNEGKTILAQYGGNACVHLPITGVTYASMVSGLVGSGAGAIAGAASGNIAAVATSAISAANAHGDIAQSNAYASSASFLGCRRPFVLIERPVSNFSKTYAIENGIPSNISEKLSRVSGFSIIGDVHLDGITATDAEKAEIERLLHEGVIL